MRSVGGCVKEVYERDPEPLVLVVLTMACQPYNKYIIEMMIIRIIIIIYACEIK